MAQITLTTYDNATSFELNDNEIVYMNPYIVDDVVVGTEITITDTAGVNNLPVYVSETVAEILLLTDKMVTITLIAGQTTYISIQRIVELITVNSLAVIVYNNNGNVYQRIKTDMTVAEVLDTISTEQNEPKVYIALLTQSGTSAPTAVVLKNTLGGTVVWTRGGVGDYVATLTGAFTANKTILNPQSLPTFFDGLGYVSFDFNARRLSANQIQFYTTEIGGSDADALLTETSITIEVYP